MKTIRHLFTVLMLLCSAVAFAHDFEVGGIYYNITDATNKTVAVTYRGDTSSSYSNEYTGDVVIPESVIYNGNTYSVTSIGEDAFFDCTGLTSIEIPNSVTSIGGYAFYDCTGLTSIEIPNSVTSIGGGAFYGCSGLTSIVVDGNNTKYDSRENCNAIIETETNTIIQGCKNTVIPNSVTSIGRYAFYYCTGLTSIEIPNSVISIGSGAFYDCYWLTSIEIPNSVTSIGDYAFDCCSGLTSVEIPNSVTSIGDYAFYYCKGLTNVVIGNSVTSIGWNAFYDCAGLTSIEIPNSVTSIGNYAFSRCTGLTSIVVDGNNTKYDSRENCNAIIETETNTIIQGCKNTVIPNSVTNIGERAFYDCTGLTSIEIPNSVTSIGDGAFRDCSGLTSIEIPNSVTSIGESAFEDCTSLTSITIPNSVTSIGDFAFYGCSGLTSIVVDGNNTKYDSRENCNAIIETETNTLIQGCKNTVIPNSVTSIGDRAFYYCTGLTSIEIPSSVTSIRYDAFYGCTGLTSITSLIPAENLFAIYSSVFYELNKTTCTLYVPYGAKETYASTSGWNEFANIVELERSTFNATFYIDGEEIATSEIKAGEAVAYPDVDEREGYTLVWTTDVDVMPSEDIVIEGTFIANTYTVTYTVDGDVYATDSIAYGSEIVLRDEPAKEGYTFSGWSEAPQTMPANEIVIEGSFRVNSYKVTFVVDGELYKSMDVVYGAEIPTVAQPVKDGREFSGWSEIPSTMPAQDVVVEGKFCYTVIFMADGKYYSSSEIYYGGEIETPSETPQKEGHTFVEWGELPDVMPARDMTIHAIFSVNKYKLIFIIDGDVYQTLFVGYGSEIEYPQKDGYIITWETENLPQTMPAENLIIIGTSALDTAVECVKDDNEKIVYTLDGHRILDVENLEKGVYIINGKKVLVK